MTIDRLLVLLLSLSFLLLAPPAVAHDYGQTPVPATQTQPAGHTHTPVPATIPDDASLFLLTAAPEAPAPASTEDGGGHDGLALPAVATLPCRLHTGPDASPTGLADNGQVRARPWATGPPRA